MGCHTWFYRKEERSIEKARAIYTAELEETINGFKRILSDREKLSKYQWTVEYVNESILELENRLKGVSELSDLFIMNEQPEVIRYYPDKGFFISDDPMPHDIFRIGGGDYYPEDELFSLEETLNYIEKNKDHPSLQCHKDYIKLLNDFWTKYPDGMINFG